MKKIFYGWLLAALAALCLLPWHQQEAGLFAGEWLRDGQFFTQHGAPAVLQVLSFGAWPLGVFFALLAASAALVAGKVHRKTLGLAQIAIGGAGLLWLAWLGWGRWPLPPAWVSARCCWRCACCFCSPPAPPPVAYAAATPSWLARLA